MSLSIPVIDLARATSPSSIRESLLVELKHALLEVGFIYVTNHGVPHETITAVQDLLPPLFNSSESEKGKCALINSPHFLGYSHFGSETTASTRDEREQFEFATELCDAYAESDGKAPLASRLHGPNQWPQTPAGTREVVEAYLTAVTDLSKRFLCLIAECLGLPPGSFLSFLSQQDRLKLVHYRSSPENSSQGVGPHKDSSGWLTFLLQPFDPSIKGLQALSKDGAWIDVPPIPGTFVVNLGQAFEVVTNGVCKATTHRVLLPPGDYHRYSVPFFQGVRLDLTKDDCKGLWQHFDPELWQTRESEEGQRIESAFLEGRYDTWGESQLRTKVRSHRDVGMKWYAQVFDQYTNDAKSIETSSSSVA
jgi:isopenicillin N synthase-like dioxygenase